MPLESQGVQAWDRFAHSYGNPVKYIDPDGHSPCRNGTSKCNNPHNTDPNSDEDLLARQFDPFYELTDDKEHSTWRSGPACWRCHVTHDSPNDTGRIPTNDEVSPSLIDKWHDFDSLVSFVHIGGLFFAERSASEAILSSQTFSRYMSKSELQAINENGVLRGGRAGPTYFTTDEYTTISSAQESLSLPSAPEVRVDFNITNWAGVYGPTEVFPAYGWLGSGIEFF